MPQPYKRYIGDGVYAQFDGFTLVLTTENGSPAPTNVIEIEPEAFQTLLDFVQEIAGSQRKTDFHVSAKAVR